MTDLYLPLKAEYFHAIKAGNKMEEFRLDTPFWRRRIEKMREPGRIILTLGYPPENDSERRLILAWKGYVMRTIMHKHFGPDPVRVFAIDCTGARLS